MPSEFRLPDLGEGIHEAEIIEVLVSPGDSVEDGQTIMVIETDKATTEVPAPVSGVVDEVRVKPGERVKVGDVLVTFTAKGEGQKPAKPGGPEGKRPVEEKPPREKAREVEPEREAPKDEARREAAGPRRQEAAPEHQGPVPASPSTRHLARELGVDLGLVPPSGPGGQVTAEDVRSFAEKGGRAAAPAQQPGPEKAPAAAPPERVPISTAAKAPPLPDFAAWGPVERLPLRSVRRATAEHMALAWSQIPHVNHADRADITELEAFRLKHKDEIKEHGGALSLTVFALKAVVAALKAHPRVNASLDTEAGEIVIKHYYHIGVAVDTDRGLVVPVVRDVDRKSLTELATELSSLVERARQGKLDRDELTGGTFTITNIGPLGGTGFSPIVNYPQVAILGMAQSRLQPVVQGDSRDFRIVPRLILPLILGFDHRVVDGADAARFMNIIIDVLENTDHMLMMA